MQKSKPERIDEIINSAIDEFNEKGYENATMESIAKRANISKGGLYHHFKSKDDILFYVNNKICEPLYAMIEEAKRLPYPDEIIIFYIKNYLSYWCKRKKEITFFFLSVTKILENNQYLSGLKEYYDYLIDIFKDIYQRGIDSGIFISHNPKSSALSLITSLDSVIIYLQLPQVDLDETINLLIDKFVKMILK